MKMKSKEVNVEAEPIIQELAEKVLSNKKRVDDQRQTIVNKIEELKKELETPTTIQNSSVNSFSMEDIENSAEPKEDRGKIAKRIATLIKASELPIYADKQYMDSIHQYLEAIRPSIVILEQKQWECLRLREVKEKETKEYIRNVMNEYIDYQEDIRKLMFTVAKPLGYFGREYEKQFYHSSEFKIEPLTYIIDYALAIDDGREFEMFVNMH